MLETTAVLDATASLGPAAAGGAHRIDATTFDPCPQTREAFPMPTRSEPTNEPAETA
jgi:hypothetical protein